MKSKGGQRMQNEFTVCRLNQGVNMESVIRIYHDAMITEPWFEDLPRQIIVERLEKDLSQLHSEQIIGRLGEVVCAAMWWDETTLEILQSQRGGKLSEYCRNNLLGRIVWFRDLLIAKNFQGMGIGGKMVDYAMNIWRQEGYCYALLRIHLGGVDSKIPLNIKAIKLYNRRGFELIEEIEKISHDINNNPLRMGYMVCHL